MSRRQLLRTAFWSTLAGGTAGAMLLLGRYLWRPVDLPGPRIHLDRDLIPKPGADPVLFEEAGFWLVNLLPGEGSATPLPSRGGAIQTVYPEAGTSPTGGIIAFVNHGTEPIQNCRLEWRDTVPFLGVTDAFYNPCSGSVFTKAGYRMFGSAPSPLDTLTVILQPDGSVIVDTTAVQEGGPDNAYRAVRP
jgi:hypothetical protein